MLWLFRWGHLGAGHLPILLAIIFTATLGFTYCISVYRGDVDPIFPYISASGNNRPESCLFSMLLNCCSFISMIVIFLRFNLIAEFNRNADELLQIANTVSYYFGLAAIFGMFVVANVQETAIIQIHLSGALLCFGSGCIYMSTQTWISFRMSPLFSNRQIAYIRLALSIGSGISFILAFGLGLLAAYTFHKHFPNLPTPRPWNHKSFVPMPGYTLHCFSAVFEWFLAILQISYFLSFSREFEKIRVSMTIQPLVFHLDHSPTISDYENYNQ